MGKKLIFELVEYFPFWLALSCGIWCVSTNRAELSMGYLILGVLFLITKELQEIRKRIEKKENDG